MVTNQQGERERHFGVCFFLGTHDQMGDLLTVNENDPLDWYSPIAVFTNEEEALEYAEKSYAVIIDGLDDWKACASTVVEIVQTSDIWRRGSDTSELGWHCVNDAYEQCFGEEFSPCELCGKQIWLNCSCTRCFSCEELNTELTKRGTFRERCGHCGSNLETQEV